MTQACSLASATTLRAASVRSEAGVVARPLWASISRPLSAFVPSRRTTTGTFTPTFFTALMTPSAMRSQRTMPPKILTSTALTFGFERMSWKAGVARRATSDVKEIRRLAAMELDEVHGRHGEARAVHHAGDVTIERYIVQV